MKVLKDKYPKGSFKYQKTDGRYIDGFLYNNLKMLATKIVEDMTFLGVGYSSTLEVGTGKSVLFTQIGEIWSELIKEIHGLEVPFTMKNVVFRPEDLIERAFQVPKYSCILLDEWEDTHYWSTLGMTLRKFFRKCRQLNLFILVIIPNLFQFPMGYAISRSIFAIDVKFDDNLNRGNYSFYGFKAKKDLYIRGKKFHNYHVVNPDFDGAFFDGYGVHEEEYRRIKYLDMLKYDEEEEKSKKKNTEYEVQCLTVQKIYKYFKEKKVEVNQTSLGEALGKSNQAVSYMINKEIEEKEGVPSSNQSPTTTYNNLHTKERNDEVQPKEEEGALNREKNKTE